MKRKLKEKEKKTRVHIYTYTGAQVWYKNCIDIFKAKSSEILSICAMCVCVCVVVVVDGIVGCCC